MRKENVFLVSLRQRNVAGRPCGGVVNLVVCGVNEASVRNFLDKSFSGYLPLSVVNLVTLESVVKKIKKSADVENMEIVSL